MRAQAGISQPDQGPPDGAPPPRPAGPAVTRLLLSDFRSHGRLRLDASPGLVVLTGPNGAGKTNILEGVSLLVPGRGLRNARVGEMTRHDAPPGTGWAVAATVQTANGAVRLGTGMDVASGAGAERRAVRVNGETARGQTVLGLYLSALWLVPAMDGLFRDGAGERRRFLDRMVQALDPNHAGRCAAHAHALRERNRLLREGVGGGREGVWLDALEDTLARHGVAIAAARRDMVGRLSAALVEAEGPFPRATLALDGMAEAALADQPALAVEDHLRATLARARAADAEAGGTRHGPHRSDLLVRHAGRDLPAALCSTGEQKAVLIALVLAQARVVAAARGGPPLLLLDEVVAHLDSGRRAALAAALIALGAQTWLTGTDTALFEPFGEKAQFLRLADGNLIE